ASVTIPGTLHAPLQVETVPGLDHALILRGSPRDIGPADAPRADQTQSRTDVRRNRSVFRLVADTKETVAEAAEAAPSPAAVESVVADNSKPDSTKSTTAVKPEPATTKSKSTDAAAADKPATENVPGAPIVVVPGPNGLLVYSDDKNALNEFESLLNL